MVAAPGLLISCGLRFIIDSSSSSRVAVLLMRQLFARSPQRSPKLIRDVVAFAVVSMRHQVCGSKRARHTLIIMNVA